MNDDPIFSMLESKSMGCSSYADCIYCGNYGNPMSGFLGPNDKETGDMDPTTPNYLDYCINNYNGYGYLYGSCVNGSCTYDDPFA